MISKTNVDRADSNGLVNTGPDAHNRNTPVFKPNGATSFSRFMHIERGQVMMTDEKEINKQGRLKVYVYGIYPDVSITSPSDLPWAYPETPAMLGGKYQQGWTSVPEVGAWVTVRFDCGNINKPIYTGTIPGNQSKVRNGDARQTTPMHGSSDSASTYDKPDKHEHDVHRYADKSTARIDYSTKLESKFKPLDNTPAQAGNEKGWSISPAKQHENITYPRNHVFSTGKHTIELDNTDGFERVFLSHMTGSYFGMDWAGDQIAESKGTMWNTAGKNAVSSVEKNVVNIAKQHKSDITQGDSVTVISGRTEMYFGKPIAPADLNMDFESNNLISQVKVSPAVSSGAGGNTSSDGEVKDSYWEFAGDHEMKLAQAFIQEVEGDYSREVKGKTNLIHVDDLLIQVTQGELTMKSNNVMNLEGSLIKLNCGGGKTAQKAPMKGGGAGTGSGTNVTTKGAKQPSVTSSEDTTARNEMILQTTIPRTDAPTISKYDSKMNKACDKI